MFFAHGDYACTGITPPQFQAGDDGVFLLSECDHLSLFLTERFSIGFLREDRSWRAHFHRTSTLVPLEARIQSLRSIQAQRFRDANRSLRSDPFIWEQITPQYASEVLNKRLAANMKNSSTEGTESFDVALLQR